MRAIVCAIATAALAVTTEAHAVERTWVGLGVAGQTVSARLLGDAGEIVDGVGLSRTNGEFRWLVPRLNVGFDLDPDAKLGFDVTASWFRDNFVATSATPIEYRVRRDVFAATALLRYTPRGPDSVLLAIGPVIGLSRFEQSGWLGDGVDFNPTLGGQFRFGARASFAEELRVSYALFVQWLHLPRENRLLADGGGATMGGVDVTFDIGL